MEWWWSWLLASLGVTGLWMAGNKSKWGWIIGGSLQILWIIYAMATAQYGFIFSALAYAMVNIRNLIKWRKDESNSNISRDS